MLATSGHDFLSRSLFFVFADKHQKYTRCRLYQPDPSCNGPRPGAEFCTRRCGLCHSIWPAIGKSSAKLLGSLWRVVPRLGGKARTMRLYPRYFRNAYRIDHQARSMSLCRSRPRLAPMSKTLLLGEVAKKRLMWPRVRRFTKSESHYRNMLAAP